MAGTQFLCFGEFILYKVGDIYSINSCETIELFYDIRMDLDKLKYASLITKIINDVATENQNTYRVMQLYLNTLYVIAKASKDLNLVYSIFAIRLLALIGYRPNIENCKICKQKEDLNFFSIKDDTLKCQTCAKQDKGAIRIAPTAKDAIRYIILSDAKKIFSFNISKEARQRLRISSKIVFDRKIGKRVQIMM